MNAQTQIAPRTIASIRAAWEAEVARTNTIVGGTRSQSGYAECLAIARAQIDAANGWQRAILFDLLRENLTSDYVQVIRDIEQIEAYDGEGCAEDWIGAADRLLAFARDKYAIAEASA